MEFFGDRSLLCQNQKTPDISISSTAVNESKTWDIQISQISLVYKFRPSYLIKRDIFLRSNYNVFSIFGDIYDINIKYNSNSEYLLRS